MIPTDCSAVITSHHTPATSRDSMIESNIRTAKTPLAMGRASDLLSCINMSAHEGFEPLLLIRSGLDQALYQHRM